ncbi:hypothetical protein GGS20DRAFT_284067 [Poronia punctata]|nr:hypothetical protein GGS20DRAFT_284067 [Poronia punctata]
MEKSAKSIKQLADQILPRQPFYLSLSPTRKYRIHPDEKRLDEQDIRHLQFTSLVGGEADRGVLITRGYFDVREEPNSRNAPMAATRQVDPNKPRKKVTLKDYRSKKAEGGSTPKAADKEKEKPNGLSTIGEEEGRKRTDTAVQEMDNGRDTKKPTATMKVEAARHRSPSPERKKRPVDTDDGTRAVKRAKVEDATPNGTAPRPSKDLPAQVQRSAKPIPHGKNEVKDARPLPTVNGKSVTSSSTLRSASPRPNLQANGLSKSSSNGPSMHKRAISNNEPASKAVPRLLSPLSIDGLSLDKSSDRVKEPPSEPRPSPKKRPAEPVNLKPPPKRMKEDREPSPNAKKRRVLPPLLSPTLPPIVMDELARMKTKSGTPSKESKEGGQRSSQGSDSSVVVKKSAKSTREDMIHVETRKEEPASLVVVMKYKKRQAKTIERLLNLPSGQKKKTEMLRKEERLRESSVAVESSTARKRPPTTTNSHVAAKRPRTSENLRPSTPPKQSIAMSRMASNSSQVGTPGATNGLTPSTQIPLERRREPIAPEKLQRAHKLHREHKSFMELGTKLKHQRDAIMKSKGPPPDAEYQVALSAGIQSLLSYMHALSLLSDALDLEQQPRRPHTWREVMPLFRVIRADCSKNMQLSALVLRIQGICMNYMSRSFWFLPSKQEMAEQIVTDNKHEWEVWRSADQMRKKLGTCMNGSDSGDGGLVGKLIDRLGPWSTPEEAIPISLEVMRKTLRLDRPFKPADDLVKVGRSLVNGG